MKCAFERNEILCTKCTCPIVGINLSISDSVVPKNKETTFPRNNELNFTLLWAFNGESRLGTAHGHKCCFQTCTVSYDHNFLSSRDKKLCCASGLKEGCSHWFYKYTINNLSHLVPEGIISLVTSHRTSCKRPCAGEKDTANNWSCLLLWFLLQSCRPSLPTRILAERGSECFSMVELKPSESPTAAIGIRAFRQVVLRWGACWDALLSFRVFPNMYPRWADGLTSQMMCGNFGAFWLSQPNQSGHSCVNSQFAFHCAVWHGFLWLNTVYPLTNLWPSWAGKIHPEIARVFALLLHISHVTRNSGIMNFQNWFRSFKSIPPWPEVLIDWRGPRAWRNFWWVFWPVVQVKSVGFFVKAVSSGQWCVSLFVLTYKIPEVNMLLWNTTWQ